MKRSSRVAPVIDGRPINDLSGGKPIEGILFALGKRVFLLSFFGYIGILVNFD